MKEDTSCVRSQKIQSHAHSEFVKQLSGDVHVCESDGGHVRQGRTDDMVGP